MMHKFSFMNQPVKILTKQGGGRLGCSWSVTKHKAIKSLEIYLRKCCRKSDTRDFNLDFYSSKFAPKMVNFAPKRNVTYMSGTAHFPTLLNFLPLLPESVRTVVRANADVITKFSGINRFPFSIPSLRYQSQVSLILV